MSVCAALLPRKYTIMNTNNQSAHPHFPTHKWVRFILDGSVYVGRAICRDRANVVATIDALGHCVTYSWPYLCDNAIEIQGLEIDEAHLLDA